MKICLESSIANNQNQLGLFHAKAAPLRTSNAWILLSRE